MNTKSKELLRQLVKNTEETNNLLAQLLNERYSPEEQSSKKVTQEDWDWWNGLSTEWKVIFNEELYDINSVNTITENNLFCIVNLKLLVLNDRQITDISSLSNLTNLEVLILCNNEIKDISPLKTLLNLKYLNLYNNPVEDIKTLFNLIQLREIYLYNNNIEFYECSARELIKKLPFLNILNLESSKMTDNYSGVEETGRLLAEAGNC